MAVLRFASEAGPKVVGLVWSKPLSSVMSANRPAPNGRSRWRTCADVTTSSGNSSAAPFKAQRWCSLVASGSKCGFSQMTVAPMPKPTHIVVRP
jgi:hypothetical protein